MNKFKIIFNLFLSFKFFRVSKRERVELILSPMNFFGLSIDLST